MCTTCGCGTGEIRIEGQDIHWHVHEDGTAHSHAPHEHIGKDGKKYRHVHEAHQHTHDDAHDHNHEHFHKHSHGHLHQYQSAGSLGATRNHAPGLTQARMVQIERDILSKNNSYAEQNRTFFEERGILALNLVSSPGSGKTALLVRSITDLKQSIPLAVIEGDQQTANDAERIRATGAPAIQINTGKGCHLDAHMVGQALPKLPLPNEALLFIENVGNLVCPASFDLGEAHKVVIFSVTEGEDKPLKYPDMFRAADIMLLNKCDLLPYLSFDVERAVENARRVNSNIEIIRTSATSGEGMDDWLAWIAREREAARAKRQENMQTLKCRVVELEARLRGAGLTEMGTGLAVVSVPVTDCVEHTVSLLGVVRPVLAMGAWFKNTLCITSDKQAYVSYSVGDLDVPEACLAHEQTAYALLDLLSEKPCAIAHDLHPDFHSSCFAARLATELQVPLIAVQHHHAHIAAVCAEHGIMQPVLGLALDGIGLGIDGAAWGGELLRVNGAEFRRLGHLRPLPLPGGDRAAREPWRMAAAALHELGRNDDIVQRFPAEAGAQTVAAMLRRDFNCPRTSSMGRLFDAAAGLLGVCDKMEFEAQAAILLESAAKKHGQVAPLTNGYAFGEDGVLDFRPLLATLADCNNAAYGAALFHATLADGLAQWVKRAALEQRIGIVALGGGCFLNGVLTQALEPALTAQGLTVLRAQQMPPGDSAISLGQAWVALQKLGQGI